ncbi:MAG: response regulator transcription factor [Candidatus Limiplasma sp.]|nr:response regulator transcription factor [Candidatus Limiplasma sp.]
MANGRILVVDDDAEIRELLRILLEGEGYEIEEAEDGDSALTILSDNIELVILDIMMPGASGYAVCRRIREVTNVPVLFLTAKSQDSDLTMGFSSGGDDYLAKPFSYAELLARVKGLLRRYHSYKGKEITQAEYLEHANLRVHTRFNEVSKNGEEIPMTEIEYQMLKLMLEYRGKIFSAQNLYESVWREPYYAASANTIMVHIRRMRAKLEDDPQNPEIIKTVWGKGYRIE